MRNPVTFSNGLVIRNGVKIKYQSYLIPFHSNCPSFCLNSRTISPKRQLFEQKLIYLSLVLYFDTVPYNGPLKI